jgi:Rrf2 family iron-sulfur cluster assembly transcriptional regulator
MQITLTQSGDYAVRTVIALARRDPASLLKAREIAEEMDIPGQYVSQITGALVRSGILEATAGPSGGYRLARPANEVSLLDVIRAIEGPLERERCVLMGGPCDWEAVCPLHLVWHEIEDAVVTRLQRTTFDELAFLDQAIEGGALPIPADTHGRSVPRRGQRSGRQQSPAADSPREGEVPQ